MGSMGFRRRWRVKNNNADTSMAIPRTIPVIIPAIWPLVKVGDRDGEGGEAEDDNDKPVVAAVDGLVDWLDGGSTVDCGILFVLEL